MKKVILKFVLLSVLAVSQAEAAGGATWFTNPNIITSITSDLNFDNFAGLGSGTSKPFDPLLSSGFPITFSPPASGQELLVFDKQFGFHGGVETYVYGVAGTGIGPTFLSAQSSSATQSLIANVGSQTVMGFYYGSYQNEPNSVVVTLSDGSSFSLDNAPNSTANQNAPTDLLKFVGFVSSNPISTVTFSQTSSNAPSVFDLTRIVIGVAAPVPEPSAYAMFGAGLALFGMIGRRRSRRQ